MKTTATFLMLVVLIPSILLGYWVGLLAKQPSPQATVPENKFFSSDYDQLVPVMPNGQRIFLVVALDKISRTRPTPQGIWLLTYFVDAPAFGFLPIYPAPLPGGEFSGENLASSFGLIKTENGLTLSPEFVLALKEHNYEWGGFILLDQTGVEQLFTLVGAEPQFSELPDGPTDLAATYQSQARIISQFCGAIQAPNAAPDWAQLSELSARHFLSDISTERLATEWQILADLPGGLRCSLPSSNLAEPLTPYSYFQNTNH